LTRSEGSAGLPARGCRLAPFISPSY